MSEFYRSKAALDGFDGRCKICDRIIKQERTKQRIANPPLIVTEKVSTWEHAANPPLIVTEKERPRKHIVNLLMIVADDISLQLFPVSSARGLVGCGQGRSSSCLVHTRSEAYTSARSASAHVDVIFSL